MALTSSSFKLGSLDGWIIKRETTEEFNLNEGKCVYGRILRERLLERLELEPSKNETPASIPVSLESSDENSSGIEFKGSHRRSTRLKRRRESKVEEIEVFEVEVRRTTSTSPQSVASSDSDFEESRTFKKRKKLSTRSSTEKKGKSGSNKSKTSTPGNEKNKGILAYFGKVSKDGTSPKNNRKESKLVDEARKAFLHSGLPEAIVKAQKTVESKKEENTFLETMHFFPKYSHNVRIEDMKCRMSVDPSNWPYPLVTNFDDSILLTTKSSKFTGFNNEEYKGTNDGMICCKNPKLTQGRSPSFLKLLNQRNTDVFEERAALPWIEKYRVERRKKLVVDAGSLRKFQGWLSHWKKDIEDDGGMSRKVVQKKQRDSDSELSDEGDEEYKKKSVVLCGPTGCGKSAMVYVTARYLGFKVVEVNFSSARSGKEVMQRVQEATLSHRLSDSAEVDESHCLVLIKDIDLLHPEEDEGFHAAVSQLISASVRPIVMTTCHPCALDSKIEKKDPLWIFLAYPQPKLIVKNILMPILEAELQDFELKESELKYMRTTLDSVARHSNCDIRKSINQSQLICNRKLFSVENVHKDMSPLLDFENSISMTTNVKDATMETNEGKKPSKGERIREIEELERISKNLELLTDSDLISTRAAQERDFDDGISSVHTSVQSNFSKMLNSHINETSEKQETIPRTKDLYRLLMYRNDVDEFKQLKVDKLNEELISYVDDVEDFDSKAYVRTIVKKDLVNSVGMLARRNGRRRGYFNRLGTGVIEEISQTFDFQEQLNIVNAAAEISFFPS